MSKLHHRVRDLTGQRWGKLTILSYSHSIKAPNGKSTRAVWNVRCDCGTEKKVVGNNITASRTPTRSCGCTMREGLKASKRKPLHHAEYTSLYWHYKTGAKNRGIKFSLTRNDVVAITKQDCVYCGSKPSNVWKSKYPDLVPDLMYNGIDRIDSSQGYLKANTVACCKKCNYAKSDLDLTDFYNHIDKIYTHLKKNTAPLFAPIALESVKKY